MILIDGAPLSASLPKLSAFLLKHPEIKTRAAEFRRRKLISISQSQKAVYAAQREYAIVTPELADYIGSDEATTCNILALRTRATGTTAVGHFDAAEGLAQGGVDAMISALRALHSSRTHEPFLLEAHLVGGFVDRGNTSTPITTEILQALHSSEYDIELVTFCCLELNDEIVQFPSGDSSHRLRVHSPAIRGLAIKPFSGEASPALFEARGPDLELRTARYFAAPEDPQENGKLTCIFEPTNAQYIVGPYRYTPPQESYFRRLLSLPDAMLCNMCSTSPLVEGPRFVQDVRAAVGFLLEHPKWQKVFPGGRPRLYTHSSSTGWTRVLATE